MRTRPSLLAPSLLTLCFPLALAGGCASTVPSAPWPSWAFESRMLFPAERSLMRPEDGVALPDGRLVVGDQVHGLRVIEPDGSSRPFGDLPGAGYVNDPPRRHGAPNGVSLEPDGEHLLVADVVAGRIYRVDAASGATERIYSHAFGVNAVVRDSAGTVWFTQCARNTEEQGEMGMFTPVDVPVAEGALWRIPAVDGELAAEAELVRDGLYYANGVCVDEARGLLYLCELAANRVHAFPLDVVRGELGEPRVLLEMPTPDNVELDALGRLWIASPIRNEVLVVDPDTGAARSAFHLQSQEQEKLSEEWARRGAAGIPRLELLTPELCAPLPGFLTGIIVGAPDGSVYLTGLGDALVRLPPTAPSSAAWIEDFATRYAAAWSSQDPERLASFYAEDGVLAVNGGEPSIGREAIAATAAGFMQAFPDMRVVLDDLRREGRHTIFHWRWTGTNTGPGGTGRAVDIRGYEVWTLGPDGRIVESRGSYDEDEYRRQVDG